ncbi:Translation initiation factor IF-3 [Lachnellula hyalina]|uniref:Translation initiation factor IF-3 n=1 Tax=Lachnellula hyalina TaxID=1316788 RepID=A0A8H8QZR3_9HELO|nr:Translation initiation factor IF-3 [Lachnellula hyalina]TVY25758.1 Translation initiation factor IF-3 [Lachnellula hyalina]
MLEKLGEGHGLVLLARVDRMRPKHFSSTATALHRVFIAPIELQPRLFRPIPFPPTLSPQIQRRTYAAPKPKPAVEKSRLPINEEITARFITVVSPDGKLSGPQNTRSVLAGLDKKTHVLTMVNEGSEGGPPLCKILNRAELYAAEKEKKKKKRDSAKEGKVKELEMNWEIDKGDERTKMKKLGEFLAKGWKVEYTISKKRRGRQAEEDECEALVKRLRETLAEGGWKEYKPAEGKVGGVLVIYCEGKKSKSTVEKEKGTQIPLDSEPLQDEETIQDEDDTEKLAAVGGTAK